MEAQYSEQHPQAAHRAEPEYIVDDALRARLAQQDLVPHQCQSDQSVRNDGEEDTVLENPHSERSVRQQQSCGQVTCVSIGPCSGWPCWVMGQFR